MAAKQENIPDQSHPERYISEYLRLSAVNDSTDAVIHGYFKERSSRGWKLISATKGPDGDWLLIEWDTSGSFSG